jgi:pimeloyl-ACP methyl ester esterase
LRQLRGVPEGAAMLATDGVFSMDGDIAPLRELALIARVQHALLYVDDAHGVGVLGPEGRGSVAAARLGIDAVPLQLATLGKALGGHGAAVVGDAALIQHLAETARPYLYTTAMPPAQAAATLAAVKLARKDHWRREKLVELVARFRSAAVKRGFELLPSSTPIQPLLCGDDSRAMTMAQALEAQGYWVAPIRPPTVPEGRSRLRITLSALHTPAEVDALGRCAGMGARRGRSGIRHRTRLRRDRMSGLHVDVAGSGPPLVLLHGWAMHGGVFAPLVERLRDRHTLHIVDLPGHGLSRDCAIPLSLEACVNAIAARVPVAPWCGWSLGGLIALHAAATRPRQVPMLAMLCASPRFVRGDGWTHGVSAEIFRDFAAGLREDYRGTLDRFVALEAFGSEHAKEEIRALRDDLFARGEPAAQVLGRRTAVAGNHRPARCIADLVRAEPVAGGAPRPPGRSARDARSRGLGAGCGVPPGRACRDTRRSSRTPMQWRRGSMRSWHATAGIGRQ